MEWKETSLTLAFYLIKLKIFWVCQQKENEVDYDYDWDLTIAHGALNYLNDFVMQSFKLSHSHRQRVQYVELFDLFQRLAVGDMLGFGNWLEGGLYDDGSKF